MVVTIAINGPPDPGPLETSTQCLHSSPSVLVAWCVENDRLLCLTEFLFHSASRAMKLSCSTRWPRYSSGVPPELPGSVHARYFGIFQNQFVIEEAEQLLACTTDIIRKSMVPPPCARYSFTMSAATTSDYLQQTKRGRHHGFFRGLALFCLRTIYHRSRAKSASLLVVSGCIIDSFSLN